MNKRTNEKQKALVEVICSDIEDILFVRNKEAVKSKMELIVDFLT